MKGYRLDHVLKADPVKRFTLGIVYSPGSPQETDTQGDYATAPEIEKACWEFNRSQTAPIAKARALLAAIEKVAGGLAVEVSVETVEKGALGVQHLSWDDDHGEILESYIAPCDMAIGKADGTIEAVKAGSWLMGIVWSPANWAKVEKGEITGLSLGGTARRVRT